ncbi:MAG: hypothetical protein ING24_09645 [Roseomonas sp.]|jgi:hypothetical protein|nr:hypothetical protein [Roseomonas sp.]MCA3342690.1 hypothetical protein [Roseomonas sp.]
MSDKGHSAQPPTIELPFLRNTNVLFAPTIKTLSDFARHHMHSAVNAARRAHEIEITHSKEGHGPWYEEMLHTVPVAIIMAAAALEAQVNEAVQDILDGRGTAQPDDAQKECLREQLQKRGGKAIDRCGQVLRALGIEPGRDRSEWDEADLLRELRNGFIHFRPAWDHEGVHDSKWVKQLKLRVPVYPPYAERFQFPYGFITYGTAKWAITTALNFTAHVTSLLGVPNRFARQDCELP